MCEEKKSTPVPLDVHSPADSNTVNGNGMTFIEAANDMRYEVSVRRAA